MKFRNKLVSFILVVFCAGCATGKTVRKSEDIGDDGKHNTVVMTYDVKLYTASRYPSVTKTKLLIRCPKNSAGIGGRCFTINVPFMGNKEVDGYTVNAFEKSGTKIFKLKYGNHILQSMQHTVTVDRIPELKCKTSKKTKKTTCHTDYKDVTERHSSSIPDPIQVNVGSGAGCYLGHLELTMFEGELVDFSRTKAITTGEPLSAELLSDLSPDIAASAIAHVKRPC